MNEFKKMREASGMSRPQFAKKFGIPYRTVQSWELYDGKNPQGYPISPYVFELIKFRLKYEKEHGEQE